MMRRARGQKTRGGRRRRSRVPGGAGSGLVKHEKSGRRAENGRSERNEKGSGTGGAKRCIRVLWDRRLRSHHACENGG